MTNLLSRIPAPYKRPILLSLVGVAGIGIAIVLEFWFGVHTWIITFTNNLFVAVLASSLTMILFDAWLRDQDNRRRDAVRLISRRELALPLMRHVHFLVSCYKASAVQSPNKISSVEQLFSEDYIESLSHLDFSKSAQTLPPLTWDAYTLAEMKRFRQDLDRIISRYAVWIQTDLFDSLQRLRDSYLIHIVFYMPGLAAADKHQGWKRDPRLFAGNAGRLMLEDHLSSLKTCLRLLGLEDNSVKEFNKVVFGNFSPTMGSGRISNSK